MAVPLRVFVVDDCRDTAEALRMLIKLWGHEVHVANDGATALELWPQLKPDVGFLDLSMPIIDGVTVASRVRQLAAKNDCRLIALTGWPDVAHRQQAIDAGFNDYLVKPVPAERLQNLLEETQMSRQVVVGAVSGTTAPSPMVLSAAQELDKLRQTAQKDIASLKRMREPK